MALHYLREILKQNFKFLLSGGGQFRQPSFPSDDSDGVDSDNYYDELIHNTYSDEENRKVQYHNVDLLQLENSFSRIIVSDDNELPKSSSQSKSTPTSGSMNSTCNSSRKSETCKNTCTSCTCESSRTSSTCECACTSSVLPCAARSPTNSLSSRASQISKASQTSRASQTSAVSQRVTRANKNIVVSRRVSLRSNKGKPPKKFGINEYVD